jgi:GR25 family glycosyltransferase involved in LPS biosynthesis
MQAVSTNFTPMPPNRETEFQPLVHPELCDRSEREAQDWTLAERDAAKAWFDVAVGVHVLSLAADKESRLKVTAGRLRDLGIRYSVVEGVDLRIPGADGQARQEGLLPSDFNVTRAQEVALGPGTDVGRYERGGIAGTLGSFLGHLRAQTTAIRSSPQKPLTVILEDDAHLSDDFVPRLWRMITRELPCDWQVVSLSSRCPFGFCVAPHLVRVQPDPNEPAWRCRQGVNQGFLGTLYRTLELRNVQRRWQRLAFDEDRPRCLEADTAMAAISDDVAFYAVPTSQAPGLLHERWLGTPTRLEVNRAKQYDVEWA